MTPRQLRNDQESEILRLNRLYDALSGVSQAIVRMATRDELFRRVCQVLVESGGFRMAWIGWYDPKTQAIEPVAMWGDGEDYVANLDISTADPPERLGPTATAFREERPYICNDLLEDPTTLPWRERARGLGLRASAAFPIRQNEQVCGTINVYANEADYFKEKEIVLLREAAADVSFALDNFGREATRKQAEELLRSSEERFTAALEQAPIGIALVSPDGLFLKVNRALCDLLGYSEPELLELTFMDLTHPDDREESRENVRRLFAREIDFIQMEKRYLHAAGNVITALVSVSCVRNENGIPLYQIAQIQDITSRRQAEQMLRDTQTRLRSALQAGSIGTWTWDIQNNRLVGDEFIARMFSIDPDAAVAGLPVEAYLEVIHDADLHEVRARINEAIQNCDHYDVEYRVRHSDGEVRWLQARGHVEPDAEGNAATFHGAVMDITERKEAEVALREAHDTLEQRVIERTAQLEAANRELEAFSTAVSHDLRVAEASDRLKSAFLATMSHELRTPLNSIIGFTGILQQRLAGPLNDEQSRQLGMVQTSARHLLELINDVLDLSKIEAGQMEVHHESFDLPSSVRALTDSVATLLAHKNLSLDVEISPTATVMVNDRRRVEQILLNLLSNAIKFTDHGRITLSVDLVSGEDTGIGTDEAVRFRVADTGIGIRPADLATLFQPFQQIDGGMTRAHEGTGLGLVICRRLATLLGGDIAATSEWSKGSVFTLTLPVRRGN